MTASSEQAERQSIPPWAWAVAVLGIAGLVNGIPHTIAGYLVLRFPTPFSGGPGTLSGPVVNMAWGLFNLGAGLALLGLVRQRLSDGRFRLVLIVLAFVLAFVTAWALGSQPLPDRFA
ncbi:hypothetical protein [Cucumibacter marinus]|uniref:hypothetical protein n=1 Tax=Cucumibacter marinus TaxID=1121252 RepID=UPI0004182A91|nr:hypothetical protein [Cucumibacter marinus]